MYIVETVRVVFVFLNEFVPVHGLYPMNLGLEVDVASE